MNDSDKRLVNQWLSAAADLNLSIVSPLTIYLPSGRGLNAPLLLKNFGGSLGTVIFSSQSDLAGAGEELVGMGYGYSVLIPPRAPEYNRDNFIEMLNEWGWNEEAGPRPSWIA